MRYFNWTFNVGSWRFGLSHDLVRFVDPPHEKYLERFILWCGITLRLHKFWSGDEPSAPHDHPWWFITIPFTTYRETEYIPFANYNPQDNPFYLTRKNTVRRFRPHFRPSAYRHVVHMPEGRSKPFWTFCISGSKERNWGFWPFPFTFVPWREWGGKNARSDEINPTQVHT